MSQETIPTKLELIKLKDEIRRELECMDELIIDSSSLKTDFQETYNYLKEKGYDVARISHWREDRFLNLAYKSLKIKRFA